MNERKEKMEQNKLNRAAQFMPFDALSGLGEELRKREEAHTRMPKKEIDEERRMEIAEKLSKIQKGDMVSVVFYMNGHYITTVGKVDDKDSLNNILSVEYMEIHFDDIYEIKDYLDIVPFYRD